MNVRAQIVTQFEQVARENEKQLAPLEDSLELLASGLDSLCFAVVVVRLEGIFGVDPFSTSETSHFPVTFGQFVEFYEHATK